MHAAVTLADSGIEEQSPAPAAITVSDIYKEFPQRQSDALRVLDNVSCEVAHRQFVCLLGPSGCGKTTLLRILAGLEKQTAGTFSLSGSSPSGAATIGMVFQDYSRSLFPWFSVYDQLQVACRARGLSDDSSKSLIQRALDATDLLEYAKFLPRELSGGMQQRVALARALVMEASILLLDEPFGSVDAQTRYQLEDHVLELWQQRQLTVMLVTHDVDEAIYLADRVFVLSPRPARIVSSIDVDLPRPRRHSVTRSDPAFGELRRAVWTELHRES